MTEYYQIINSIIPEFNKDFINTPFIKAGIDSIDMLTIRVEFEKLVGKDFQDSEWLKFNSLLDIISFCIKVKNDNLYSSLPSSGNKLKDKKVSINMPQMAIGALSENWLFKEIGDTHWDMLCAGLNTKSYNIKDESGNRLYATFVRIRMQSTTGFNNFIENDDLNINGEIMRFGNGMYFSNIMLAVKNNTIETNLMTSFSIRNDTDNTKLMKSQPTPRSNSVHEYENAPAFGNEYRLIKKGITTELKLANINFKIHNEILFNTTYNLNPYYDLNGVGLLYFAAYPIINNTCEALFFNAQNNRTLRWEMDYHVIARDVLYFANCNITDSIEYVLHEFDFFEEDKIKISSSLYRQSDKVIMAKIFTIKARTLTI